PDEPEELKQDWLVDRLTPDPGVPASLRVLAGWLGASTRAECWRLYLTPELNEYIEVAEADIVHKQSLAPEDSPLGGSVIWVNRDAKLYYVRVTTLESQAEFFAGDILQLYADQSGYPAMSGQPTMMRRPPLPRTTLCTVEPLCIITRKPDVCYPTG